MTKTEVLIAIFLFTCTEIVFSSLTVYPKDTQVMAGHSTTLTCSTDNPSKEIFWNYYPVGVDPSLPSSTDPYVYRFGFVMRRFRPRFQVEKNNRTGATNLVIGQVNLLDAGTYLCQDNDGAGEARRAQLIVLEPKPICKFNVKSDVGNEGCELDPQELELHCSVSFSGNSNPSLEWIKVGETMAIRKGVRAEYLTTSSISLILTLKAELSIDASSYICQTTGSPASPPAAVTAAQYNCTSDGIQITCYSVTGTNREECRFRSSCRPTVNRQISTNGPTVIAVTPVPSSFPLLPVVIALVITLVIAALVATLIIIWRRHKKQIQSMIIRAEQLAFRRAPERICYREEPIALHTIRLVYADERQQRKIRGVTVLGQEVFVVSSRCPELVVYDSTNFAEKRRFDLPGMVDAWDIASCKSNNYLFVMDGKEPNCDKEIIKFEPSGDVKLFWNTKRKAGYLSVARDGNVVLAVYEKNVFVEYSAEGQKIRKIRINPIGGEVHPHHAFKLDTGHFVVIHGIGDNLHRACVVNEDTGALVRSFGGKKGSGNGQMNLPKYLAVDNAGSVMVLDQNNNRVLLLGFDLQFQRELVTGSNGLLSPCKIHLDETGGRLFVAQSDSIHIFDILQRNKVMPNL